MKRYRYDIYFGPTKLTPDPAGEWVRYEDVKALEGEVMEAARIISSYHCQTGPCNCRFCTCKWAGSPTSD